MLTELDLGREQSSLALDESFKRLSKTICMLLSTEGVHIRAYRDGLPYFSKLTVQQKESVVQHLRFFHDLCLDQVGEGYKLKDSLSFTWRAFRKLGLTPPSDLFHAVTDEHIVEIYSSENVQLFRNFNFFNVCSYSLEELHSLEWWSLYRRDPKITQMMFGAAEMIFTGQIKTCFPPNLGPHVVEELSSTGKLRMEYNVDLAGPLFKNKIPQAVILLERARLL